MQVRLLLNILQMDLIVGCGKLILIVCKFALLTFHFENCMTQSCKVTRRVLGLA